MTITADLELRQSKVIWFDGAASDFASHPLKMYSVVTPIEAVQQYFADNEEPVAVQPGNTLVVLGAADGNTDWLWLEVDDKTSSFAGADVCLAASKLKYLCEVGEDLHMKRLSK